MIAGGFDELGKHGMVVGNIDEETNSHKKLFYDDTFVLFDYEFDSNINKFK